MSKKAAYRAVRASVRSHDDVPRVFVYAELNRNTGRGRLRSVRIRMRDPIAAPTYAGTQLAGRRVGFLHASSQTSAVACSQAVVGPALRRAGAWLDCVACHVQLQPAGPHFACC